jgi:DNA-binding MarR family transcriptional regulator
MGINLNMRWSATQLTDAHLSQLVALANALRPLQADLSLSQLLALIAIAVEPGLSVNELADRLNIPQQTASRHVAGLLGRYQLASADAADARSKMDPLIKQEINSEDPRRRALFLSDDGQQLLEKFLSVLEPISQQLPRRSR